MILTHNKGACYVPLTLTWTRAFLPLETQLAIDNADGTWSQNQVPLYLVPAIYFISRLENCPDHFILYFTMITLHLKNTMKTRKQKPDTKTNMKTNNKKTRKCVSTTKKTPFQTENICRIKVDSVAQNLRRWKFVGKGWLHKTCRSKSYPTKIEIRRVKLSLPNDFYVE